MRQRDAIEMLADSGVEALGPWMTSQRRFLIVEYDTNEASRWLPNSVSRARLAALCSHLPATRRSRSCAHGHRPVGALRSTPP
jgi:hypothetical protein